MSYRVEKAFFDLVRADPSVSALIGSRVYPNAAPQDIPDDQLGPHVIYFKVSSVPERHLGGPSAPTQTRLQVDCYARSYATAQDIAHALREATDGYSGTVEGNDGSLELRSVRLEDMRDIYEFTTEETGWHRVSCDFLIWHASSVPVL